LKRRGLNWGLLKGAKTDKYGMLLEFEKPHHQCHITKVTPVKGGEFTEITCENVIIFRKDAQEKLLKGQNVFGVSLKSEPLEL